jgi:hypothetical protein
MYTFLFMAHSGWRWIVLILLVITAIKVLIGWLGKQQWTDLDTNLVRFTHLAVAIQVFLGIILYVSALFADRADLASGRFIGGHIVPALLTYGAVLFAMIRSRRLTDGNLKFRDASIGLIAAIILVYGALVTVGGIFA